MRNSVLITGGAKRIGASIARYFAQKNWRVIIHYNSSVSDAFQLKSDIIADKGNAEIIGFDLAQIDEIDKNIKNVFSKFKDIRVIINNASIFEYDSADNIDFEIFDKSMAINCIAPIKIMQAFAKYNNQDGDKRIINLVDQKLLNPNPDFFSYSASKTTLWSASKMLAMGLRKNRIKIFNIAPGICLPSGDQTYDDFKAAAKLNLLQTENDPISIAQTAFFLSTRKLQSSQTIFVDSGQHLVQQTRDVMFMARGQH